jgi:hypothetical protein
MGSAHLILTPTVEPSGQPVERAGRRVTFDELAERLAAWPRMFFEPDGAFVWVSGWGEPAWQLDGQVHDSREGIAAVELKGRCPGERFQELLAALGWPGGGWTIHDPQQGERLTLAQAQQRLSPD